ncbi:hypothetical protein AB2M62_02750 [Sphingomonas sp. MMS12-HWE2-04]|uniref:hypothetical protein n=1 Tax=Sphingomonas sp. MMS12-HWE2-04 TaxID=3234199 RepID=UPI00384AD3CB
MTPPPIAAAPAPAAPAPAPVIQVAPAAPVVQAVPPVEQQMQGSPNQAPSSSDARPARTTRAAAPTRPSAPARAAAPVRAAAPAPAPVAAAPAASTQPASPAPVEAAPAPAPVAAAPAPEPAAPVTETTATTTEQTRAPIWPWVLGGLAVLGAILLGALMMRRRRNEAVYTDEVYEEPRVVAEPVPVMRAPIAPAAMPVAETPVRETYVAPVPRKEPELREEIVSEAHTEAELAEPESEDLNGIADAPAPVANRPWLEFGLRPVRAGTSEEEAVVDVELTVGNAGDTAARDVRISTFLLADAESTEMEHMLTGGRNDAAVPPVTIAPGDGTRVDAHLAVPKGEMGRTFNPVIVAEARYTLPDGSEGRTSAAFRIGRSAPDAEGVGPIGATRPHMVEDVEAELYGQPEHA